MFLAAREGSRRAGFRMPAVNDRAMRRWPASESRQRTNPRVMGAEGAAYSAMGIWVMRKVGATDRNPWSASNNALVGGKSWC